MYDMSLNKTITYNSTLIAESPVSSLMRVHRIFVNFSEAGSQYVHVHEHVYVHTF